MWPGLCPALLAYDAEGGSLVMTYLDARQHPLWKSELRDGRADGAVAAELGRRIGAMHAATADRTDVAARFDNLELFEALRLEPYLDTTARAHADLAPALAEVRAAYLANRRVLLHGDVSPKNVLVGPDGPVLLDAECATWGDPAFDLAFCADAPAAEVPVEPRGDRRASSTASTVSSRPISSTSTWEPLRDGRGAGGPAGRSAAARSGRREVTGGVPRRAEPGGDAGSRPLLAAATRPHRWPAVRARWAAAL